MAIHFKELRIPQAVLYQGAFLLYDADYSNFGFYGITFAGGDTIFIATDSGIIIGN